MKLVWTRPAREGRKAIREYIAADNPNAAPDLDELMSEKAAHLINHSDLGRIGRVKGTRELVAHRSYILIYDIANDLVRALRILHTAQMWPSAKKEP